MTPAGDISWLHLIFAFVTVAALLAGMGWILKYVGMNGVKLPGQIARQRRMKIIETLPIDPRRRLMIVSCDGREHLLLLSAGHDIVVETNLPPTPVSQ